MQPHHQSINSKFRKTDNVVLSDSDAAFYKYLSVKIWGNIPSPIQRKLSKIYTKIYDTPLSKQFIKPYCKFHYNDPNYLDQFKPPNGKTRYESFQDFFIRQLKEVPLTRSFSVWPCEGLLCDLEKVKDIKDISVKGDISTVYNIFGLKEGDIPEDYTFSNVFLHNKNYHRIHTPITGTISRIQHIKGDLVVLRPWIYKHNPSLPAFRNERVNIDIVDGLGRTWYLSVVGGPAVGTIELPEKVAVGNTIEKLDELALFYLGSTCCMAAPIAPKHNEKNSLVEVGNTY
ncbi:phosphatidylserine decarboxylase [Winogradskyella sp. 3972H.M.0a.05]|uniref:phosphatidylserine decarboxylase n=1 Tax=Winogradskyella sp. 3972H.M.0a.05 TaxID=2950277 RepID=UPI003390F570